MASILVAATRHRKGRESFLVSGRPMYFIDSENLAVKTMSSVAAKVFVHGKRPYETNLSAEQLALKISDPASVEHFDASAFGFYSEVDEGLQHAFLYEMHIDHRPHPRSHGNFLPRQAIRWR
ncbi:hypothetical protein PMI09_01725 [Rhizobium sp. CF122]|nr:hypothetical protein PMI09_01725 [Rhizobium sp. CF122]